MALPKCYKSKRCRQNGVDPDQRSSLISGSTLFAQACLSKRIITVPNILVSQFFGMYYSSLHKLLRKTGYENGHPLFHKKVFLLLQNSFQEKLNWKTFFIFCLPASVIVPGSRLYWCSTVSSISERGNQTAVQVRTSCIMLMEYCATETKAYISMVRVTLCYEIIHLIWKRPVDLAKAILMNTHNIWARIWQKGPSGIKIVIMWATF